MSLPLYFFIVYLFLSLLISTCLIEALLISFYFLVSMPTLSIIKFPASGNLHFPHRSTSAPLHLASLPSFLCLSIHVSYFTGTAGSPEHVNSSKDQHESSLVLLPVLLLKLCAFAVGPFDSTFDLPHARLASL